MTGRLHRAVLAAVLVTATAAGLPASAQAGPAGSDGTGQTARPAAALPPGAAGSAAAGSAAVGSAAADSGTADSGTAGTADSGTAGAGATGTAGAGGSAATGSAVTGAGGVAGRSAIGRATTGAGASGAGSTAAGAPAGYPVAGIDVSSHDHAVRDINWPGVAASGVRFAYVKATEGTTYVNPYFASDYRAARRAGLYVGAYAYGRPDLGNPVGQADHFISQFRWTPDTRTLVPFLDLEWPYGGIKKDSCWGLSPRQMTTWIRAFLSRVEASIGRPPMIYTNTYWWNPCTGRDASFGRYPLDIASYTSTPPTLPAGWNTFAIWQYAPGNPSRAGVYDRDVINGGLANLAALAGPRPRVVSLRSRANGRVVVAPASTGRRLAASGRSGSKAQRFDLINLGNGYAVLRSRANGRYVTADRAGRSPLVANRTTAGAWAMFRVVRHRDGTVSLKARANNRYVSVTAARTLLANRTSGGTNTRFTLRP